MLTHPLYGALALLDQTSPDALATFCLAGSRAPLLIVEAMLLAGRTADEICVVGWLGLEGRQALVERVAEIQASLPRKRTAA